MNQPSSRPSATPAPKTRQAASHKAETTALLDEFSRSLRKALTDHQAMLEILLQRRAELPLEIGELLEDTGNAYLEMSENVSQKFLTARNSALG